MPWELCPSVSCSSHTHFSDMSGVSEDVGRRYRERDLVVRPARCVVFLVIPSGGWRERGHVLCRHPLSHASLQHSQSVIQPCMWFIEEPSQFSAGQTAQTITYSIKEKPHMGLYDCLRMLQACFRQRKSGIVLHNVSCISLHFTNVRVSLQSA